MASLHLAQEPTADKLISKDPLALLIGMVLDQQIPLEKAFAGPAELARRLGRPLDVAELATMDPDQLAKVFSIFPSIHRYPGSMAARVQALCRTVVDDYGGDAARVWKGAADGTDLLARVKALPGFGEQKAKIFVALLGKQLKVRTPGWEAVSLPFSEPGSLRSVADIVGKESLDQVRAFKQQMKEAAEKAAGKQTAGKAPSARAASGAAQKRASAAKKAAGRSSAAKSKG